MYKREVYGKGCIVARIVADSVAENTGTRITTFELEYPRFIHSELMTHRMFSRNAMSSRAVPIAKMIEQVRTNPAMPVVWGKNQPGMQAKENLEGYELDSAITYWKKSAQSAADYAHELEIRGVHKQIVNRVLEPFQVMKTVVTVTELNNWWHLRDHGDAQPEIAELARVMRKCYDSSETEALKPGEWHVPYVVSTRNINNGDMMYGYYEVPSSHDNTEWFFEMSLEDAKKVSASCCAQVSFRQSDTSIEKAKRIYDRLVESKPVHASPFEHQATPMQTEFITDKVTTSINDPVLPITWEGGITHQDKRGFMWSGNFKHWIQHRQLIDNNVQEG